MNTEEFLSKLGAELIALATSLGIKLLGAMMILFIGIRLVKWFVKVVKNTKAFRKIDPGASSFIASLLSFTLKLTVVLTAIATLGVPMTNFITVLGSAGLAIGLAMQGSLSNLAGGFMLLIFHPFKVGDYINAGGISGSVREITILYTRIDTADNVRVTVPNGELSNATVTNYSANAMRRVDLSFGVSYESDVRLAIKLLTDMTGNCPYRISEKEPFVKIGEYGESQINIYVRLWVSSKDYRAATFYITEQVKEIFDKNGIVIPYPQMDIHLDIN